ncbi:hypothetical protein BFS30_25245 [Pedobacter steynii]|uniref:Condensation domain-containing protein n=2 Tax=Pedobacter steynii TaxID=430522 RepID=A0A1D7QND4_9SPHI|nr:hypothetical protein BFS30_25245 [Pedobacter steynii]
MNEHAEIITEPSIGQLDHLKYLTESAGKQNVPYMVFETFLSKINVEMIEKTLSFMVKRHESLRTIFPVIDGEIKQVILPYEEETYKLEQFEIQSEKDFLPTRTMLYQNASQSFSNLDQGPHVKFILIKNADNYFFSFLINHIFCDAWSLRVIEQELFAIYTSYVKGEEPKLPPLKLQLKDYCFRQNAYLHQHKDQLSEFWANKLKGFNQTLRIEDFYRSYSKRNQKALQPEKKIETEQELTAVLNQEKTMVFSSTFVQQNYLKIKTLAQRKHCTVSAIVYASFYALIFLYSKKSRVLLAALVADRGKLENRQLIGCLLGGTYLPMNVTEEISLDELIDQAFPNLLEGIQQVIYCHSFLGITGSVLRTSSDMYTNYIPVDGPLNPQESQKFSKEHRVDEGIYYAINCMVYEYSNGLAVNWRYNTGVFAKELMEDLVKCHETIMDSIIKNDKLTLKEIRAHLQLEEL